MDQDTKKTALHIGCGIYVPTADDGTSNVGAATVNWVTQTAFPRRSSSPRSPRRTSQTRSRAARRRDPRNEDLGDNGLYGD